jgi:hypothetical protein
MLPTVSQAADHPSDFLAYLPGILKSTPAAGASLAGTLTGAGATGKLARSDIARWVHWLDASICIN